MSIRHYFSNTVPDWTGTVTVFNSQGLPGTAVATDMIRPSDWDSAHNQIVTIAGNTLGVASVSGSNIVLAGGNNVTISAEQGANAATISFAAPAAGAGAVNFSAGTTSGNLAAVTFADSNGVSFGLSAGAITATVKTDYLTTAMASNRGSDFVQANAVFAGTNASGTIASNGISVSVGNYLTTQSGQAFSADASSTFQTLVFQDSNGVSFSNNAGALRVTHGLQFTSNTSNITSNALHSSASRVINIVAATNNTGGGTASLSSNVSFSAANGLTFYTSAGGAVVGSHNGLTSQSNQAASASNGSFTFQTLNFSNANNVTFGTSAGGIISASVAAQSNQSAIRAFGVSNTGQTAGNTGVSTGIDWVLAGSNSITLSQSTAAGGPNTVWIQHPAWITTARAATDAIGLNTAQSNVTWTVNSSGLSLDARGYAGTATTFAGTNISGSMTLNSNGLNLALSGATAAPSPVNISAGTTSNNLASIVFADSNQMSFGLNGSTVTASFNPINIGMSTNGNTAGTTGTFDGAGLQYIFAGGDNVTLSQSSNGASVTLSIAAGGGGGIGGGVSTGGNTAGSTGTVTTGNIVFVGSNGITLSQSTGAAGSNATITIAGIPPLSTFVPYPFQGASTNTQPFGSNTSAFVRVFPFMINEPVSAGIMNMLFSASFVTVGTSSGRQTAGIAMAIYTRGTGTNSTKMDSMISNSFAWTVTGNNSSYSVNQVTATSYTGYGATAQTNSAGSNLSSGYTGVKAVGFPINSLLTPGVYWLGVMGTNSTTSNNVGVAMSLLALVNPGVLLSIAPFGSFSTNYSLGSNPYGANIMPGLGAWSSAGSVTNVPASMAFASISFSNAVTANPILVIWST